MVINLSTVNSLFKWAVCIGWMMSAALALGILFGLYEYSKTTYISFAGLIIYAAFGRVLWSVAVSWVIFACSTGHGSKPSGHVHM